MRRMRPKAAPIRAACHTLVLCLLSQSAAAVIVQPADVQPPGGDLVNDAAGAPNRSLSSIRVPEPASNTVPQALQQRAQSGDTQAMLELGYFYDTHPSLPQANTRARQWWTQAAQQGDARAMMALGYLLSGVGGGASRDTQAARAWLERASDLGLTRATYVRSLLERQSSGPTAQQRALQLLEQAARDGDVMALNDLGVERELAGNKQAAADLYRDAAQGGLELGRHNLQRLQSSQRTSDGDSLKRLHTLADEGDAQALLALAYRYHLGEGVQTDYARAIHYYQRAADAGSGKAREFLALILARSNGNGTIDPTYMRELATRISAAAQWSTLRRSPALSRPARVQSPLSDLLAPMTRTPSVR